MKPRRLLDQVRFELRCRHYSIRTENSYVRWIKRFIHFHHKRHPAEMGEIEVMYFVNSLVSEGNVSASSQNKALCAILFMYRAVLKTDLDWVDNINWSKRPKRLPVVFTVEEVVKILALPGGQHWLMASLLYDSGLRLMECVRLRIQDVDFGYHQILVRNGKSQKDRITISPGQLCTNKSTRSRACTTRIWQTVLARSICRTLWRGNIPTPTGNSTGSICFPPETCRSIPEPVQSAATMCPGSIFRLQ